MKNVMIFVIFGMIFSVAQKNQAQNKWEIGVSSISYVNSNT